MDDQAFLIELNEIGFLEGRYNRCNVTFEQADEQSVGNVSCRYKQQTFWLIDQNVRIQKIKIFANDNRAFSVCDGSNRIIGCSISELQTPGVFRIIA